MSGEHDRPLGCSLEAYLQEPELTEGQRRRLRLFQTVEAGICARIERYCTENALEVTDLAVLVIAPEAQALFFDVAPHAVSVGAGGERAVRAPPARPGAGGSSAPAVSVILGHRERLHGFLHAVLPPCEDAPFDPYADLIEPSPSRCVRVLIVDHESLTVMSYGMFVTLRLDVSQMPQA
jgi:hypothetical protein